MTHRLSIQEITALIKDKRISVSEVVDQHLSTIESLNPKLNAFCTVAAEEAKSQARAADKRLDQGIPARPLEGIPVGIKDITPTAGIRTTYGSKLFENHVPETDDLVVARLKEAGAIILGKTNTSEFAAGAHATNALFGPTRNPWNAKLTAGGSTGGGAAAVASGMAMLAEGSDLGGSLRIPASFCGVVGIRPSVGLVPTVPNYAPWNSLQVQGPIARTPDDVARMLKVISGYSAHAPTSAPIAPSILEEFMEKKQDTFRICYAHTISGIQADKDITQSSENALNMIASNGIHIDTINLDLSDGRDAFLSLRGLFMAQHHSDKLDKLDEIGANLRNNLQQGLKVTTLDLAKAEQKRTEIAQRLAKIFEKYDAILTPCMPIEPFPAEENFPTQINGKPMETYIDWVAQTFLITLASVPALSVPFGLSNNKLPMGWQLIGPPWSDGKLLAIAERIQETLPLPAPPHSG